MSSSGTPETSWTEDADVFLETIRDVWVTRVVPPQIPGYQNLTPIGRGGQGIVFKAEQLSTRRQVAVKVLEDQACTSYRRGKRFELGLELVARLRHPNIAAVHDSGLTEDGRLFLSMELVEGHPLSDLLPIGKTGSPLRTLDDGLKFFRKIIDAIAHAHRNGVIHRDLKPSNILVDTSDDPVVVDFGLAKEVDGGSLFGGLTQTGEFLGSLAYASPEQLEGKPDDVDARTDIYALGAILFQMLTGKPPRSMDGSVSEVLRRITQVEIPSAERLRKQAEKASELLHLKIAADLQAVVDRSLAHNRDQRYSTAEQLGEDIDRLLAGLPVTVFRNRTGYVFLKAILRHKFRAATIALLLSSLIASSFIFSWQRNQAQAIALERAALLDEVLGTYEIMMKSAVDGTARLAGAAPLRREIVEAAHASFADFLLRYPNHFEVRFRLAQILDRLADIERAEGQLNKAKGLQIQALRHHQTLLQVDPNRMNWRMAMSFNLIKLGDLHKEAGNWKLAHQKYLDALKIDRELSEQFPKDPGKLDNLFWSLQRIGFLEREFEIQGAENHLLGLLPMAESIVQLDPGRLASQAMLYEANHVMSSWAREIGDHAKAIGYSLTAVNIIEGLAAKRPWRKDYQQKLLIALRSAGESLERNHESERASETLDRAEKVIRDLAAKEIGVLDYQGDLHYTLCVRARVFVQQENFEAAFRYLEEAYQLAKHLQTQAPDKPNYGSAPATTLLQRSTVHEAAGQLDDALADAENALSLFHEQCPPHENWERRHQNFRNHLAHVKRVIQVTANEH